MTLHEQQIRQHCAEHHIQVRVLQSGALHFQGPGVDLKSADWRSVSMDGLAPYQPRKYVDLYAA